MNHRIEQLNRDRKALVRIVQGMKITFGLTLNHETMRDINTLTRAIFRIDQELGEQNAE